MRCGVKTLYLGKKTEVKTGPTARDYVQDGLISMFDGIENSGYGVSDRSATTWIDLAGGHNVDISRSDGNPVTWDAVSLVCEGKTYGYGAFITNGIVTLELVEEHAGRATNVICQFNSSRQAGFGSGEYELSFSQAANNASISTGVSDDENHARSVSVQYGSGDELSAAYINGQMATLLPRKSNFGYYGRQRIGGVGPTTYNFSGRIMSIRVYSRVLTAAEIAANYAIDQRRFGL